VRPRQRATAPITGTKLAALTRNSSWAPTVCIQLPTLLTNCTEAIRAKSRERNGAHADERVSLSLAKTCENSAVQRSDVQRGAVRFLVFSASLRAGSLNTRLADLAAVCLEAHGGSVDRAWMREFDCPSYDFDAQSREGFPAGAQELHRRLEACDAFVVCSPEYNASLPGALKNAIDWVSRYEPQPFNERHGLLLSASPSMVGGNRGLWALRIPFEHLGARVYPDMFSLAQAHTALDNEGRIADARLQERFETNIVNFMDLVEASKHYPCVKRAWVEYLGEHPEPALDRVE
jgi:chromate reductase